MYSPKRRLRLFRNPAFISGGGNVDPGTIYNYSWSEQTGATAANYYGLESSSDFSLLAYTRQSATDGEEGAFLSLNEGSTWTRRTTGITWGSGIYTSDVAIAADNSGILFIANRGTPGTDYIWRSTDGGSNWSPVGSLKLWTSVSCSANGSNVVATELTNSNVWVSSNTGSNWTQISISGSWFASTTSHDGTFMMAIPLNGTSIQISRDSGSNWSNTSVVGTFRTFYISKCSSNGEIAMINTLNNPPLISRNYGSNWSAVTDVSQGFTPFSLAMSRSGRVIVYSGSNLPVFISQDEGVTWQNQTSAGIRYWSSFAMNDFGSKIIAGPLSGKPWVATGT